MIYSPKFLRVNLSTGRSQIEQVPEEIANAFVGARGFGAKYLYTELGPGIDPLGPENKLLFLAGPLAGTGAQSVSRWMTVTKSPLTGTFTRSSGGGGFGAWLKWAGYDFIIIDGRAERPSYIYIEDGKVEIRDASFIWGQETSPTQEKLKEIQVVNQSVD